MLIMKQSLMTVKVRVRPCVTDCLNKIKILFVFQYLQAVSVSLTDFFQVLGPQCKFVNVYYFFGFYYDY